MQMQKVRFRLRRGRKRPALALRGVAVLLMVVAVAACGSSSKNSASNTAGSSAASGSTSAGSSGSTASQPKGSPINVMTIASVNYAGPNYDNILATAKVYGQWINAHGGINGHPLNVTTCDEQGDPTRTAQCGRDAIANHDVAIIGSFTLNGNAIIPELQAAKTSWFGICCAASSDELVSPVVQQIGSDDAIASALMVKATEDGCKKPGLVLLNAGAVDTIAETWAKAGLKSVNGPPLVKTVLLPLTAQDYAPQVAQATNGTDCIIADIAQANFPPFMQAFEAAGATQRIYGPQGNLDITVTKPFPKGTENAVIAGTYSDISLPVWSQYRQALSEFHAPSKNNYNSLGGLGTWAAYVAFDQIVSKMTGPINNATFLAAAQKATVDLPGMVGSGPIDFAQPFTGLGPAFKNLPNRAITFDVVHNGVPVPFDNGKFFDMTNALTGQPLPAADTPPGGQGS